MQKDTIVLFHPLSKDWDNKKARIPYSILFLERNLRDLGFNIVLIDEFVDRDYKPILRKYYNRIFLAGVSTMTGHQLKGAIAFSTLIRTHTDATIVWGGWHPTILPDQTLESDLVDYAVIGQGEEPFRQLILTLINKGDVATVLGIGYKKDGKVIINPRAKYRDAFSFPKIDYTLVDVNKYIGKNSYANRSIRYIASQGCPYKCGFCSLAMIYERRYFHKTIPEIMDELEYFIKVGNIDGVKFDDDNFFVNREFVMELCREMIKRKLNLKWFTQGHASHLLKHFKEEDFAVIRQSGAVMISIGAESGDQVVLDLIAKNNQVEDNIECARIFNKYGIQTFYTVMVCFPINPERDFRATINLLMDAKLYDHRFKALFSFYTPYPGTDLWELALQKGYTPPQSLNEWSVETWKKIQLPWVDPKFRRQAWRFMDFYMPLADPYLHRKARWFMQPPIFLLRILFHRIVIWRFKHKNLNYPIEATVVLYTISFINKILQTRLKLKNSHDQYFD